MCPHPTKKGLCRPRQFSGCVQASMVCLCGNPCPACIVPDNTGVLLLRSPAFPSTSPSIHLFMHSSIHREKYLGSISFRADRSLDVAWAGEEGNCQTPSQLLWVWQHPSLTFDLLGQTVSKTASILKAAARFHPRHGSHGLSYK